MSKSINDWAIELHGRLAEAERRCANEEELRLAVHETIAKAGADLFGISEWPNAEQSPGGNSKRAYDNLYGGAVVEWEWAMGGARREKGAQQALDYLSLVRQGARQDDAFTAVVCDGKQWGFLTVDPSDPVSLFDAAPESATAHFIWDPNSVAACRRFLELVGTHRQQPINARALQVEFGPTSHHARRFILLMVEAIASRLPDSRPDVLYLEWRRALDVAYGDLDEQGGELASVLSTIYGLKTSHSVGEHLFVLHTYFALVARLIAVEMLAISVGDPGWRPSLWVGTPDTVLLERIEDLEAGHLPSGLNITNLFEADVFSWWSSELEANSDLQSALRDLLSALSRLAFPRAVFGPNVATDVLTDLYQSIVPPQLRRKLGEYLTPQWLAEASLARLVEQGADFTSDRVLDPTCGTGTFLVPILNRKLATLRNASPSASDVQAALDQVAGIDINPVSVIATRVNFVVALGPLAGVGDLTLRVWRADSLLVPDSPPRQGSLADGPLLGRAFRELPTSLPQPFPVPPLLTSPLRMDALCHLVAEAIGEPTLKSAKEYLETGLTAFFGPTGRDPVTEDVGRWSDELTVAGELLERIWRLDEEGLNGVWAQIISNAYAPLFAGKFNVVVGNPPWLAWGRLPESWRRGSERLWRRYGLWRLPPEPGDTSGTFQVTDLATLVFATAIDRYADDDGLVGLLTPESLLIANPGSRAFRRFRLLSDEAYTGTGDAIDIPFAIVHVDNWSEIQPFAPLAANRPVFSIARKGRHMTYPVKAAMWRRAVDKGRIGQRWSDASSDVAHTNGEYAHVHPEVPTSSWSFRPEGGSPMLVGASNDWVFGTGMHTRGANGVFYVNVVSALPGSNAIEVENDPSLGRNVAVMKRRGRVEAALVYPLLRGRDVTPWHAEPSLYCVAPHDPAGLEKPVSAAQLGVGGSYELAGRWLRLHRDVLQGRKTPPNRNWNMDPSESSDWCRLEAPFAHMRNGPLVVVREISGAPAAAIVSARFDDKLERTEMPLVDHKLMFCSVGSEDEATYLTAFINSTPAQDFLLSFSSTTGFTPKARATLPIPPLDSTQPDVATLVEHGRAILAQPPGELRSAEAEARQADIDHAVLRLGNIDPSSFKSASRVTGAAQAAAANDQLCLFADEDAP